MKMMVAVRVTYLNENGDPLTRDLMTSRFRHGHGASFDDFTPETENAVAQRAAGRALQYALDRLRGVDAVVPHG
jgi:hypothetical protein